MIDLLYILHGDNHQRKDALQDYLFGWLWPVVPFIPSGGIIFDHQYQWKESSDPNFLHAESYQGKATPETFTFWLVVACCVSHPIRLKESLNSQKSGKTKR